MFTYVCVKIYINVYINKTKQQYIAEFYLLAKHICDIHDGQIFIFKTNEIL